MHGFCAGWDPPPVGGRWKENSMRQRKIKDVEEKLDSLAGGRHVDPVVMKGRWQEIFEREQPVYLELGSGKGQFIMALAEAFPERNFIAMEGNHSVMFRALQKAAVKYAGQFEVSPEIVTPEEEAVRVDSLWSSDADNRLYTVRSNLVFANMYLRTVTDCFAQNELSGIYLNFSDPWPKAKQAKRRLTHTRYLQGYREVLRPGSCLEFKTDNEELFRFSMEEFQRSHLEEVEYTEDLHGVREARRTGCAEPVPQPFLSAQFFTEYEEKFTLRGKPIYYCKVRFA